MVKLEAGMAEGRTIFMDRAKPLTTNDASTELARERTRQAADRPLMAWTSLSLIGFGFGIAKYRDILMKAGFINRPPEEFNSTLIFGLSFISLGVFGLLAAVIQHWRILKNLDQEPLSFPLFHPLAMITAIILLFIGIFAFVAVLVH